MRRSLTGIILSALITLGSCGNKETEKVQRYVPVQEISKNEHSSLDYFIDGSASSFDPECNMLVIFNGEDSACNGFIITKDGYALTNNHCIDKMGKLEVDIPSEENLNFYEAEIVASSEREDLALIKIRDFYSESVTPLTIRKTKMKPQERVFLHSFDFRTFSYVHTQGFVTCPKYPYDSETNLNLVDGQSGSLVLDEKHEVVGMAKSTPLEESKNYFCPGSKSILVSPWSLGKLVIEYQVR